MSKVAACQSGLMVSQVATRVWPDTQYLGSRRFESCRRYLEVKHGVA